MDKIKINNQIILMRKHVKQAKIHTINKLVKQVKLLQNRKGTDANILKAKRKADRYLEEVAALKKMKPDYVSKQALSKEKYWKDVLVQKSLTIEDRCLATLASYESIQKEVEKFHSSNPVLAPKIRELIQEWELKGKATKQANFQKAENNKSLSKDFNYSTNENCMMEEIKSGGKEKYAESTDQISNLSTVNKYAKRKKVIKSSEKDILNENKIVDSDSDVTAANENEDSDSFVNNDTVNKVSDLEVFPDDNDSESDHDNADSSAGSDTSISSDINKKSLLINDEKNTKENDFENQVSKHNLQSEINNKISKETIASQNIQMNSKDQSSIKPTKSSLKKIAMFNLAEMEGLDEILFEKKTENEDESEEENANNVSQEASSDPFFLRPGEIPVIKEKKHLELPRENKNLFSQQEGKKKMNRFERRNGRPKKYPSDSDKNSNYKHQKSFSKGSFQAENRKEFHNYKGMTKEFPTNNEKGFKRKQDVFQVSDKHSSVEKSKQPPYKRKDSSYQASTSPQKKDVSDKPLHPSWEAKRKLKEGAQKPFQGKRMVFKD